MFLLWRTETKLIKKKKNAVSKSNAETELLSQFLSKRCFLFYKIFIVPLVDSDIDLFNALTLGILWGSFVWWMMATLLIVFYSYGYESFLNNRALRGFMGFFVLMPFWAMINTMRLTNPYQLLFLLVLIWGADSAAYFVGRKWGRHKLAFRISPGKSWEGLAGAILFSIPIALIYSWTVEFSFSWLWIVIISWVTVIFSVIGDLFESMLKRKANVKDSGQIIPGHGGLLDRIDSLTAAVPVFGFCGWLLRSYLSH